MPDIAERLKKLTQQILDMAQECLSDGQLEGFQDLNGLAVEITRVGQRFPKRAALAAEEYPTAASTSKNSGSSPGGLVRVFRRYKHHLYEADLDPNRIQPDGRGECIRYNGNWYSASGSAVAIANQSINGWVNFWRYRENGNVKPIDEIRKKARKGSR